MISYTFCTINRWAHAFEPNACAKEYWKLKKKTCCRRTASQNIRDSVKWHLLQTLLCVHGISHYQHTRFAWETQQLSAQVCVCVTAHKIAIVHTFHIVSIKFQYYSSISYRPHKKICMGVNRNAYPFSVHSGYRINVSNLTTQRM